MSQLRVSAQGQDDFFLNVLRFESPVFGEMNSSQTKTQIQYFPIKAFQPELTCSVIFPSEYQWEQWQAWVRQNMLNSQNSNATGNPGVTLNWPQRNINNWTAVIPSAKAGGMRRNYTPRTRVEFQLIVSLVSNLGVFSSFGSAWQSLFTVNAVGSVLDGLLTLPAGAPIGAVTPGNARIISGGGPAASNIIGQSIPGVLTNLGGILP